MTKMLNSENLLADSGLEPQSTAFTADKILYNYAIEQCQAAALDELFGNPEECFQVCKKEIDAAMHSLFTLTPPKLQFTFFLNAHHDQMLRLSFYSFAVVVLLPSLEINAILTFLFFLAEIPWSSCLTSRLAISNAK